MTTDIMNISCYNIFSRQCPECSGRSRWNQEADRCAPISARHGGGGRESAADDGVRIPTQPHQHAR